MASRETVESRTRDLLRRVGLGDVQPGVALAAMALCAIAVVWAAWRWWPQGSAGASDSGVMIAAESSAPETPTAAVEVTAPAAPAPGVMVHVAGSVRHPGVYELGPGARVVDAVEAAGGALADARLASVNLARPVTDGEQILVPDEDDPQVPAAPAAGVGVAPGSPVGAAAGGSSAGAQVDLNTADHAALDTLPGVGPSTAAKIIADREANGPFTSAEDLRRVSGIGEKKFEALKDLVCVR